MNKRFVAPVALAGALLAGAATVGGSTTAYAATPKVAIPVTGLNPAVTKWVRAHRAKIEKAVVSISATTIGDTPKELVKELRSGKSIAEVAGEHSSTGQAVATALVTAADSRINQAVTAKKLSSTEASTIEAALPGYVTTLVNHTF